MRLKLTKKERTALLDEADNQGIPVGELVTGMVRRAMSRPQWFEVSETAVLLQEIEDMKRQRDSARSLAVHFEQEAANEHDRHSALQEQLRTQRAPHPAPAHVSMAHVLEAERLKGEIADVFNRFDPLIAALAQQVKEADARLRAVSTPTNVLSAERMDATRKVTAAREAHRAMVNASERALDPLLRRRAVLREMGATS